MATRPFRFDRHAEVDRNQWRGRMAVIADTNGEATATAAARSSDPDSET
jgi:hypothetical protein